MISENIKNKLYTRTYKYVQDNLSTEILKHDIQKCKEFAESNYNINTVIENRHWDVSRAVIRHITDKLLPKVIEDFEAQIFDIYTMMPQIKTQADEVAKTIMQLKTDVHNLQHKYNEIKLMKDDIEKLSIKIDTVVDRLSKKIDDNANEVGEDLLPFMNQ